jgi:Ca2+-binding RTX toxin-like protein
MKRGRGIIVGLVALCALYAPAASYGAQASTSQVGSPGSFYTTYRADKGEANNVTVDLKTPFALRIDDRGALLVNGINGPNYLGCSTGLYGTTCTGGIGALDALSTLINPSPAYMLTLSLGDRDDQAVVRAPTRAEVDGGPGNDRLSLLVSGSIRGGAGADVMSGDTGLQAVEYSDHAGPITLTLDDLANDGTPGENDNVRSSIESIVGTHAADTLIGNDAAQAINGVDGADHIEGRGGNDNLSGGTGVVAILGGAGEDTLGSYSDSVLDGGDDNDVITPHFRASNITAIGGDGNDTFNVSRITGSVDAGPGDDMIIASSFEDPRNITIVCGTGTDTVWADSGDVVAADCETVHVIN